MQRTTDREDIRCCRTLCCGECQPGRNSRSFLQNYPLDSHSKSRLEQVWAKQTINPQCQLMPKCCSEPCYLAASGSSSLSDIILLSM
ncbi:hypothetical protein AVEN_225667-1 [Araneus ventricosus]|uniref:Uncharacterized protein n=1 Tax=Araneus ventricosus TaxID=182803 RepID=A0A4Y2R9T8_ARAVE|nr:hypothetical protein AVEN_225667-1 [Araneus ventricosus]